MEYDLFHRSQRDIQKKITSFFIQMYVINNNDKSILRQKWITRRCTALTSPDSQSASCVLGVCTYGQAKRTNS